MQPHKSESKTKGHVSHLDAFVLQLCVAFAALFCVHAAKGTMQNTHSSRDIAFINLVPARLWVRVHCETDRCFEVLNCMFTPWTQYTHCVPWVHRVKEVNDKPDSNSSGHSSQNRHHVHCTHKPHPFICHVCCVDPFNYKLADKDCCRSWEPDTTLFRRTYLGVCIM